MRFTCKTPWSTRLGAAVLLVMMPLTASGDYTIDWWTVDGGGAQSCTGGGFTLSGTIGQPDASAVMSGGDYALRGGFWVSTAIAIQPGDINGDGYIDFVDAGLFADCMSGPDNLTPPAGCDPVHFARADLDDDGDVDMHDMAAFAKLYGGGV